MHLVHSTFDVEVEKEPEDEATVATDINEIEGVSPNPMYFYQQERNNKKSMDAPTAHQITKDILLRCIEKLPQSLNDLISVALPKAKELEALLDSCSSEVRPHSKGKNDIGPANKLAQRQIRFVPRRRTKRRRLTRFAKPTADEAAVLKEHMLGVAESDGKFERSEDELDESDDRFDGFDAL